MNKSIIFSKENRLFDVFVEYISLVKEHLIIISPFINSRTLELLLSKSHCKVTIITTWKINDLLVGSSDLALFPFCRNNNFRLYLNQRVHLKALINNFASCLFGSANISNKALGLSENYAYEMATIFEKLSIESVIYFRKILKESVLVNDEIYEKYMETISKYRNNINVDIQEILIEENPSDFLISALPMSKSVEKLFELYKNGFNTKSAEEKQCALHDIVLYNIPLMLDRNKFFALLKKEFIVTQFITKLLKFIGDGKYFGQVKEWVQNNCTDVPIPSRRSLTGNIQVLYQWIVDLYPDRFDIDRPRYSQRIYRVK